MPDFADAKEEIGFALTEAQLLAVAALAVEIKMAATRDDAEAEGVRLFIVLTKPTGSGLFAGCIAVEVQSSSRYGGGPTARAVYDARGDTVASGTVDA